MNSEERLSARIKKIRSFNPDENGLRHHGIFGLPFDVEESEIVLLPIPWEVTVSYATGTAKGPQAIVEASQQIDLYDPINPGGWKEGIAMQPVSAELIEKNNSLRKVAEAYLEAFTSGDTDQISLDAINKGCDDLCSHIKEQTSRLLGEGRIVGIVGGDHSVPLGYLQALAEIYEGFGILQIDAHADLRDTYEGFTYSHASIFFNALKIPQVQKIVQLGIRDFSAGENEVSENGNGRSVLITDYSLKKASFEGIRWQSQCEEILSHLPSQVYISFDIDGLEPSLCPNTGTPVMGGFRLDEVIYLFERLVESGRQIIGFDLCEVAPGEDEWDGNVGSRVLYKLCMLALKSNGKVH